MSISSFSSIAPRYRRRGRIIKAGLSVLTSGEPAVWLTGGALMVCVAMIVGLVAYIVYSGLVAFWPVPVVELKLHDGGHCLGAPIRSEEYQLTQQMTTDMSPALQTPARAYLQDRPAAAAHRTLFRTGIQAESAAQYRWISDFEVAKRNTNPWAVAIEEADGGRIYGYPESFLVKHPRVAGDAEVKLGAAIAFFEKYRPHLNREQQKRLDSDLALVRAEFEQLQLSRSREFIAAFHSGPESADSDLATRIQAVLSDGRILQAGDGGIKLQTGDNVVRVIEIWEGAEKAWRQYQQHHPGSVQRTRRIQSLAKHRIGALNQLEQQQRLTVREAEIRAESDRQLPPGRPVTTHADLLKELQQELASYKAEAVREANIRQWIKQHYGEATSLAELANEVTAVATKIRARFSATPRKLWRTHQQEIIKTPTYAQQSVAGFLATARQTAGERQRIASEIESLEKENDRSRLVISAMPEAGESARNLREIRLDRVVRAYRANGLTTYGRCEIYFARWVEFLTTGPKEGNSGGGVFPAIWGTVAMTMIMTVIVVPFGVLAALYLREYATSSLLVSGVRIAIHNLAGVPSIVFGVFGLGFFCYIFGAYIDGGPTAMGVEPWPPVTWFVCLAVLAIVGAGGFFLGMVSRRTNRQGRFWQWAPYLWFGVWLATLILIGLLVVKTPYFNGFFPAKLPAPTFGKGGLFWASLTLALLTAPVVIVATEEALAAVPNSLREGSYACGASKWQTIRRIVLPHAAPGIVTGAILAMARGAGEVAPLMLTGAVKLAPDLPVDASAPFIHWDRSFMHLGFHIYDLGFHSSNAEAAKPMVFATTLLLIAIVAILNLSAVWLRARLRKQFQSSHF